MSLGRPPRAITVARVQAIDIELTWRWAPVLVLGTWLLAQNVLPARFPTWQVSTTWLTAGAAVLAGEAALLLHELGHALVARLDGQRVTRIVFHGFLAETIVDAKGLPAPAHVARIALAGPVVNVALAGLTECLRLALATQGPVDAFLLMLIIGNIAAGLMSMVPVGNSDGARAVGVTLRRRRLESQVAGKRQDEDDQNQQA